VRVGTDVVSVMAACAADFKPFRQGCSWLIRTSVITAILKLQTSQL